MNITRYTPHQILTMRKATLRYLLTKQLAVDSTLAGKISALVGFAPRWYSASAIDLAMTALAWAIIVNDSAPLDHNLRTALDVLKKTKERAYAFHTLSSYYTTEA